jgi:hypothetical protein
MQIEACLICDSASDYQGKLCILGAFDTIWASQAPVVYPHCAVATRLRFQRSEEGKHSVRLVLIDQDGNAVLPPLQADANVVVPPGVESACANLVLGMMPLQLPRFGVYHMDLAVDGDLKMRLPLNIVHAHQIRKAA